jgi:flagellar biogenesis protein FliO
MKARRCFGLIAFLAALLTVTTHGASLETNSVPRLSESSGYLMEKTIQTLGALIFVISILILGAWLFKRSRFFSLYKGSQSHLRVLESRSIGYRNSLLVVGYDQHRYLLAASSTGVSLLAALPDSESNDPPNTDGASFANQLNTAQESKT